MMNEYRILKNYYGTEMLTEDWGDAFQLREKMLTEITATLVAGWDKIEKGD